MKRQIQSTIFFILSLIWVCDSLNAQQERFNFQYNGPDTIFVNNACLGTLNWGHPGNPVISSKIPGVFIQSTTVTISGGYMINSNVTGGTTVTITYKVLDTQGFQAEFNFTIRFQDNTSPQFDLSEIPSLIQVSCGEMPELTPLMVSDNCTAFEDLEIIIEDDEPFDFCLGNTVQRIYTVIDEAGNSSSFIQIIEVEGDNTHPVLNIAAMDLNYNCDGLLAEEVVQEWLENRGGAQVSDNCTNLNWTYVPSIPDLHQACQSPLQVVFTAADGCGNSVSTTANITISDTKNPVITNNAQRQIHFCDGSDIISLLSNWLDNRANSQASDNCTANESLFSHYKVLGNIKTKSEIIDLFQISITRGCEDDLLFGGQNYNNVLAYVIVEFVYEDYCSNMASTLASFVAIDTIKPAWVNVPQDIVIQCNGQAQIENELNVWYNNLAGGIGTDNCGYVETLPLASYQDVLAQFVNSQSQSCGRTGFLELGFYLKDACGNLSRDTLYARFEVIDTISPLIIIPAGNVELECGLNILDQVIGQLDDLLGAELEDVCSEVRTVSFNWEDSNGLSGIAEYGDHDQYPLPSATDCSWSVTVTFIFEDQCGNTNTSSGSLEVLDTTVPVFTYFPSDISVECDEIPEPEYPIIEDNCVLNLNIRFDEISFQNPNPQNCNHYQYIIHRIWVASDACGNMVKDTQVISVSDTRPPSILIPPFSNISCAADTSVNLAAIALLIQDNCDQNVVFSYNQFVFPGNCAGNYRIERQWRASDRCNNISNFIQQIFVTDQQAPVFIREPSDLTLGCLPESNLLAIYNDWLESYGDSEFTDVCSGKNAFAAIPGTYSINNPASWPGQAPVLPQGACGNSYFIEQQIDFVYYDDCGNAAVRTVFFRVIDEEAPLYINCVPQLFFDNTVGACSADLIIHPALVFDQCTGEFQKIDLIQDKAISSSMPGNIDIIVDPVDFDLTYILGAGATIINAQLKLTLRNVDGEGAGEFFRIISEDGRDLGRSSSTILQCGSSTTIISLTNEDINKWLNDGVIYFTLEPNIPIGQQGRFSINDICPGATANLLLSFEVTENSTLLTDWNLNGGAKQPLDPIAGININNLSIGTHTLRQFATDCFGNVGVCVQEIIVADTEAPVIICPNNLTVDLVSDSCEMEIMLPRFISTNDNCGYAQQIEQMSPELESDALLTFAFDPDLQGFMAEDRWIVFEGLQNNAEGNPIQLIFELRGNIDEPGAYFSIFNEDNNLMGTTEAGQPNVLPGDCNQSSFIEFELDLADFNRWVSDGELRFLAVSHNQFTIPPGGPDSGINPCDPSQVFQDGDRDGISFLKAFIKYESSKLGYEVSGATLIPLTMINTPDIAPSIKLTAGVNTIKYVTWDISDNTGSCNFEIHILDGEAPRAFCKNTLVYINPSGLINYQLIADEVDNESSDNCGIVNYIVNPSIFNCGDIGLEFIVTLTVTDGGGLSDTCTAQVRVESFNLQPRYDLDICKPDTLKLFANVPPGPPGNIYTYRWVGPNNFLSFLENPIIISPGAINSGTYILEVTGSQSCGATGSVTISIPQELGVPDIFFEKTIVCEGELVMMETQQFTGSVTYQWYRGISPNGVLMAETNSPGLTIPLPPGTYSFYVVVRTPNCASLPSVSRSLRVLSQVIATVEPEYIELCEGQLLQVSTTLSGSDYRYQWIGPNGFTSDLRTPLVSNSVGFEHAGFYTLFIFDNGCPSTAADLEVFIKAKPIDPIIFYDPIYCPGQALQFTVNNVPNADAYRWILPNNSTFTTLDNHFQISQATNLQNGQWRVIVIQDGCESDFSIPILVDIEQTYQFQINNPGPKCEGDTILLSAEQVPGASYRWYNSESDIGQGSEIAIIARTGAVNLEIITEKGCKYELGTQVLTIALPTITAISSDAQACMDGSRAICFFTTVFPPDQGNYTYHWTGPGFSSGAPSPCIPNGSSFLNGNYNVIITNSSGCKSEISSIEIIINDIPERPVIQREVSYCEGQIIDLLVQDYGPNAQYFWNTPLGLQTIQGTPILQIPSVEPGAHSGAYSVRVLLNGCFSEESQISNITVYPIPARPLIDAIGQICEGDSIKLRTVPVSGASYTWEGPGGFSGVGNEVLIFPATVSNSGNYTVRTMINGCLSPVSQAFFVQVNKIPDIPKIGADVSTICADLPGASFQLCVDENDVEPSARYTWFHAESGLPIGPQVLSRCITVDRFENFSNGINEFIIEVNINGCKSALSIPIQVRVDKIPAEFADAGPDLVSCGTGDIILNALPLVQSSGEWRLIQGNGTIIQTNNPASNVIGLASGENRLVWAVSYRSCLDFDRDTMLVTYQTTPLARDDNAVVTFASFAFINVLTNDDFPSSYSIDIVTQPMHGTLSPRPNGGFEFLANPNYVGNDFFEYQLCASACPGLCSTARVYIQIGDDSVCDAPNIITPNGDGTNDVFFIPCLSSDLYPNNRVVVYNEWGAAVLEESPYSNTWQGTYKGQDVPVGTYFYVVEFGGDRPDSKGFLIIKR
jgi:gliding motility-associated-like protein